MNSAALEEPVDPIFCGKTPGISDKYFHHRITPIENFVRKIGEYVEDLGSDARIGTERSVVSVRPSSNVLTIRLNDQEFSIHDLIPDRFSNVLATDHDNLHFLRSVAEAVPAFAASVITAWPSLSDQIGSDIARLERRLSAACHDSLSAAARREKGVVATAKRDGRFPG